MPYGLTHLQEIPLWPDVPPGSENISLTEVVEERSPDVTAFRDRAVTAIGTPRLLAWVPEKPNGTSVVLAPGGGYVRVVLDKEGYEIAEWLNGLGVTVFILLYRLPGEGHANQSLVPLQDAQRALRLVRANADRWGLSRDRIVAMGCSAGGHVVGSLATMHDRPVYAPVDEIDKESARPDYAALIYAVLTMEQRWAHPGSRRFLIGETPDAEIVDAWCCEKHVGPHVPPCFMEHAADDASVPVENSLRMYNALHEAGVQAALHVFESGGHGHGIRLARGRPVEAWTLLFANWLQARQLV